MEKFTINLEFLDKGYGRTSFTQTISYEGKTLEFIVRGLKENEKTKADDIVRQTWDWVSCNMEAVKDYLSTELAAEFETMRQKKEKNIPPDDVDSIRHKLKTINANGITFYPTQSTFEINFVGEFNGSDYGLYVTMNDNFTFKKGSILTMGGFKAPKGKQKKDLTKAKALYEYHLEHENERGLYKHYEALPAKEIKAFIDLLIADNETDEDTFADLALYLALFSFSCGNKLPDKLYEHLITKEIFYYGEIYLRADEKFAARLIKTLDEVDDEKAYVTVVNHILCALAMIPCKQTNDFLISNSNKPLPIWAKKLHILPKEYAKVGGWEAVTNGEPTMLFSETVTAFESCEKKENSRQTPLSSLDECCGFCGQPLTLVFDGENKLATCLHCSCFQIIFTKTDGENVYWHKSNKPDSFFKENPERMKNDENIVECFTKGLRPSSEARKATWTANQFVEITLTQIGGMPTAVNDMIYPQCPDCGKTMRFAAQLDMEDIQEYGEGLYYFFVCDDCHTVGTNYDQT